MAIKTSTSRVTYPIVTVLNGQPPSTGEQTIDIKQWRSGNERPDWKRVINEGGNATTALEAYTETVTNSDGFWEGFEDGRPKSSSTKQGLTMTVAPNPVAALSVRAKSDATTKAYKILNRLMSEFSGQQFAGEFRQTKNLLMNPYKQSLELIKALFLKHPKKHKNKNPVAEIANSWLEFQFGMRPLLSDIDAILLFMAGEVEKTNKLVFRAYGEAESSESSHTTEMLDIYGWKQSIVTDNLFKAQHIIRFGVFQEFLDKANKHRTDWQSQFDDVSQIPITAWNLLPWSWLIDYVVNISDIISAATTVTTGVQYWSNSAISTVTTRKIGSTDTVLAPRYHITRNVPRVYTYQKRRVSRDGAPLGIPSVVFTLPGSNVRYLNIAAIVASLSLQKTRRS